MSASDFQTIWEFRVPESVRDVFLLHYGPEGSWARLFALGEGYLGTELLQDGAEPSRFLTLDRWRSRGDFETFKARYAAQYEELDERCEALTESEHHIGWFSTETQIRSPLR